MNEGYWKCYNCYSQYEDHEMNGKRICDCCSDEDDLYYCTWEKENQKVNVYEITRK